MKKKLEADLISIAHRILKLKNKSDINQLYLETQKLYEKLAVLKFIDENFDSPKPTIGRGEIESQIETIFEKEEDTPVETKLEDPVITEEIVTEENFEPEIIEEIVAQAEEQIEETVEEQEIEEEEIPEPVLKTIEEPIEETIEEPVLEEKKETEKVEELSFSTKSDFNPIPDFKPAFELEAIEEEKAIEEEISTPSKPVQILFEDFGINYADAHFVKVDNFEAIPPAPSINEFKEKTVIETEVLEKAEPKIATLNEKLAKGFHIDLNDRIAFTKNLFGNSSEDYSRVLNQLLTFDTYNEAQGFIENMVKPDYNNWEGKDDYAERFLGIIEKKFS
ncbi:hypothetical protein GON26_03735 [Flavobacterium sp. GA093]|uniref:Uncharacterized protein n=1 Tax=Flavobacterium hydrocarbonoxydans TaxID=2683249 RepID=A0A6I4NGN1_9FLAO|nr:hypothetical protein [Flavobacterium hydrocarbonoxydans]MWB93458.1 hypothetical protein [Flavobacterium hydrocarbonoxydans]